MRKLIQSICIIIRKNNGIEFISDNIHVVYNGIIYNKTGEMQIIDPNDFKVQ